MRPLRHLLLAAILAVVMASCTTADESATTTAAATSTTPAPTSTTTSTTESPPTTTTVDRGTVEPAPAVASRRADLDGDGDREHAVLYRRPEQRLMIDDVQVELPFDIPEWSQLFVVDLDDSDGLRELALLRRFDRRELGTEEPIYDVVMVAFVDGVAYIDRPARLYDMIDMIENRAVLNGEIKASSSNCLITTSIHHVYGPKAKVISRQVTFAPSERDDPACGNSDLWITREADLDGDGQPEEIMLQGRRLFVGSDVVEVPYPGQRGYSGDWGYLGIIDVDPEDGMREVMVWRPAEEELAEILIVAYANGKAYSSGVLDIYSNVPDMGDGAVLNNQIVTLDANCALATRIVYVFGPLAQVIEENQTTTGTYDPNLCFG